KKPKNVQTNIPKKCPKKLSQKNVPKKKLHPKNCTQKIPPKKKLPDPKSRVTKATRKIAAINAGGFR
ncbi:MAG: hypothetical protein QF701_16640, partial [Nitrospinota bacterium]|nr:hypothetical protein [Nitrospinota bacterium]